MRPVVDVPEWLAENYEHLTDAQIVHLAGASYWGALAVWHLKAFLRNPTDVRSAKAEALAELAARHALAVLGRDPDEQSARTRGLPGHPV